MLLIFISAFCSSILGALAQETLNPTSQSGTPAQKSINDDSFGAFRFNFLNFKENDLGRYYDFELYEADNRICSQDDNMLQLDLDKPEVNILQDTPYQNCKSAATFLFSGGMHCCTTAILVTNCDRHGKAFSIELEHSDSDEFKALDLNKDGVHQMSVIDWAFAYYEISRNLRLSFASSPYLKRLLLFEDGKWSPDPPGKFAQYYIGLMQEAEGELKKVRELKNDEELKDDEDRAALAITRTYYAIMAGHSDVESEAILNRGLPRTWQAKKQKVFGDVKQAVFSFNPVKSLQ
jgi:hypothetical protein